MQLSIHELKMFKIKYAHPLTHFRHMSISLFHIWIPLLKSIPIAYREVIRVMLDVTWGGTTGHQISRRTPK